MPETPLRKLAAILAADIAGYSALMGSDEERTVRDLKAHQATVLPMIGDFGGRVIDTAGDGILAEFGSAVKAVECAVAIQQKMVERNAKVEPERRMRFRIGINIGDVIYDEARIYGDGLNIAARLESIAEPGGIFISRQAYDQVDGKLALSFRKLGPHTLKNILKQVEVFAVDGTPGIPVSRTNGERRAQAAATAPSIDPGARSPARWLIALALLLLVSLGAGGAYMYMRPVALLPSAAPAAEMQKALEAKATPDPRRFDGSWVVDIACPNTQDALGWGSRFVAQVKDGYFSGTRGSEGKPGWMTMEGKIQSDGAVSLFTHGLTGDPATTVGNVPRGSKYTYHILARFEGSGATGKRVEHRPCDFTAFRQ
jgi:class 3 adenylate cyclase